VPTGKLRGSVQIAAQGQPLRENVYRHPVLYY
jgi:hypothetical protein